MEASPGSYWESFTTVEHDTFVIDMENRPNVDADELARRAGELGHGQTIKVRGIERPEVHALALALEHETCATLLIDDDGSGASATLVTNGRVDEPEGIPQPPRPNRLSAEFPLEPPEGLANDYATAIADARLMSMPETPVSVIIPVYNRRVMLERTLACLTHQTYPLHLIEIVIADDGSSDEPEGLLDSFAGRFGAMRIVRQEDKGYRLSEVRNLGLEAAANDLLILLDCDMAPVPRLVELFVRHLSAEPNAIYCGHRRYVDANEIEPSTVLDSIEPMLSLPDIRPDNIMVTNDDDHGPTVDWRLPMYQATDELRHEPHPFLAVCGGNIGFTRATFDVSGPFDIAFTAWGGEDAEWGYRAWNRGVYIIPILDACGLHQEPPGGRNETDREAGRKETLPLLVDRCPVRWRKDGGAAGHSVPLVSIYVPAYNAEATIVDAIKSVLRQSVRDLEVCVVDDGSTDNTADLVRANFGTNPRVRFLSQRNGGIGAASNAAVRMCRAPFIGQLDADDRLKKHAVRRMLRALRSDTRIGVAYSSSELIDRDGQRIGDSFEFPYYSRAELLFGMIVHHFRLFRARDWYRTAGFATDMANAVDYDMYLKMSEVTEMVHIPVQTYQYRKHPGSTSQSRNALQRHNHRMALGRAMQRRGLATRWDIVQVDPTDPRDVDFVPVTASHRHFGNGIDTVRVRVETRSGDPRESHIVKAMFPKWKRRNINSTNGSYRMVSPQLSHARAIRCVERLRDRLPDSTIELVYS